MSGTTTTREQFALSTAQLGVWFAQHADPDSPVYKVTGYVDITGPLNADRFRAALRQAVSEAEGLRARFGTDNGVPWQCFDDVPDDVCPVLDLTAEADPFTSADAWMRQWPAVTMDSTAAPLFRFALLRLSDDRSLWFMDYHHLVIDGAGVDILLGRLAALYADADTAASAFPPLRRHLERKPRIWTRRSGPRTTGLADRFADQTLQPTLADGAAEVSRDIIPQLAALTRAGPSAACRGTAGRHHLARPADRRRRRLRRTRHLHRRRRAEPVRHGAGHAHEPGRAHHGFQRPAAAHRAHPGTDLAGAGTSDQQRIPRHAPAPALPRRAPAAGDPPGRPRTILRAVGELHPVSRSYALGDCRATVHNISIMPVDDLSIVCYDLEDGGLRFDFDANPALYQECDVAAHRERLGRVLARIAERGADGHVTDLPLVSAEERRRLLTLHNDTDRPIPAGTLPAAFRGRVAAHPTPSRCDPARKP